jgi:hypothetical protein
MNTMRIPMRKAGNIAGLAIAALMFCMCTRVNYEQVRAPISTVVKSKDLQFQIESQPSQASTYVDSIAVGTTPVTVQTPYECNEVTYKEQTVLRASRTGGDIGVGIGLLSTAVLVSLLYIADPPTEGKIAVGVITGGLAIPGLALLIRGSVLKARNGKVVSTKQVTLEECPQKKWKLILAKDYFMPAERMLSVSDAFKPYLVALTPAGILGTGAPPPAALDKAALLSSMAAKTDPLTAAEQKVGTGSKKVIEERMKNLSSQLVVGKEYEAAGNDIFFTIDASDIKMFEMTTEKDYCYIIAAVGEPDSSIYMGIFRGGKEIAKDFRGQDISSIQFCSDSSDPVRVTTSTDKPTAVGLRIYFLAK